MHAADSDLPDAAVEHISQMLTLAKSKHQEAMALLGTPDPNALPRLREVLRLHDAEHLDKVFTRIDCALGDAIGR